MAAFSRLDLGPNLRTGLGPEYFRNLLASAPPGFESLVGCRVFGIELGHEPAQPARRTGCELEPSLAEKRRHGAVDECDGLLGRHCVGIPAQRMQLEPQRVARERNFSCNGNFCYEVFEQSPGHFRGAPMSARGSGSGDAIVSMTQSGPSQARIRVVTAKCRPSYPSRVHSFV